MLNSNGRIEKILGFNNYFEFYSCDFLKLELLKHRNKILRYAKLSSFQLDELEQIILANIRFKDEALIPEKHLLFAEKIAIDVDPDDIPFVALTSHLKGLLWTGDKKLIKGLNAKGFIQTITTTQLFELLDEFEK
jgi:predicted nucleic acid-binding protein